MNDDFVVTLFTYNRLEYATRTINSFFKNIETNNKIHFHIADDGSSQEYRDKLYECVFNWQPESISISVTNREGYGANYNKSTIDTHSKANYMLPLEDDWNLERPFPIDRYIKVLKESKVINSIRFGYIGYTQELRGKFIYENNEQFLLLDPDSPERHVFSGHPRLETVKYQRAIGEWLTGVDAGTSEFDAAARPEARTGVAWPVDFVHPRGDLFSHIGTIKAGNS